MKRLFLSIVILLLLLPILAACNDEKESEDSREDVTVSVETKKVKKGDLRIEKSFFGRTSPSRTTPVISKTPGEIDQLDVQNGDVVKKDDRIATIKSPVGRQHVYASKEGEIAKLEVKEGDFVSDTDPLALIIDTDELKIDFSVTSDMQQLFKKDEEVKAFIDSKEYTAKVLSIDTMPDDTGLYPVEAVLDNDKDEILAGMIAEIRVVEKKVNNALILPTEAIIEESDKTFVYVVKDDKAVRTEVEIVETQTDKTAIKGEVSKGDEVVINGQLTLTDGSKVDVVKEGSKS